MPMRTMDIIGPMQRRRHRMIVLVTISGIPLSSEIERFPTPVGSSLKTVIKLVFTLYNM